MAEDCSPLIGTWTCLVAAVSERINPGNFAVDWIPRPHLSWMPLVKGYPCLYPVWWRALPPDAEWLPYKTIFTSEWLDWDRRFNPALIDRREIARTVWPNVLVGTETEFLRGIELAPPPGLRYFAGIFTC